jgi:hypothetical protein
MSLAHGDRECMKLIEEQRLVLRGVGGEGLTGEIGQGVISLAITAGRRRQKPVALGYAAQVLIGDGNRMAEGVEQDRVGGLRTHAGQEEQASAQSVGGAGGKIFQ